MSEPRYRIGAVARLAGVSTHALRVWERRYGVPTPDRSQAGARLYSDEEVERLRLLKRAVDRGHAIGQIASLERAELERLAGGPSRPDAERVETASELQEEFVLAVARFDAAHAERLLERASVLFPARTLVLSVLAPLLARIGRAWASGDLCTASEHVASALVRDQLSRLLRQLPSEPGAELLVVSTPAAEQHELGALLAAALAKIHGYALLYLGPNLPAQEIALAARTSGAQLVALSIVALDERAARAELRELSLALPPKVRLLLGGARAASIVAGLEPEPVAFASLEEFERFLLERSARPAPRAATLTRA